MADDPKLPGDPVDAPPASPSLIGRAIAFAAQLRQPMLANAYALVANQVLSAGLGLVYWPLATHLFSAGVVGSSSAVISTILLISGIAQVGLGGGMNRFLPRAGDQTRRLILMSYGVVIAVSVALSAGFMLVGAGSGFSTAFGGGPYVWLWVVLASVLWSIFRLQDQVLIGLRQAVWVLAENTIFNVAKIGLLFVAGSWLSGAGIVGSWFLPTPITILLVTVLIFGFFTRAKRIQPLPEGQRPPTIAEIASTSGGDHVGSLVAEASGRLLPVLVLAMAGDVLTAYFAMAWLVASALSLISGGMTDSFTAQAAGDRANIGRYSREIMFHLALLVIPASVVLGLGAPLVLQIFKPEYADGATPLLRWLCLASPLVIFNNWYLAYARVVGHIRMVVRVQVVGAVLLLGGSWLLLSRVGIAGIGLAWIGSQAVTAFMGARDSRGVLTSVPAAPAQSSHS